MFKIIILTEYIFNESQVWPIAIKETNMIIFETKPENPFPIYIEAISLSLKRGAMAYPESFLYYVDEGTYYRYSKNWKHKQKFLQKTDIHEYA